MADVMSDGRPHQFGDRLRAFRGDQSQARVGHEAGINDRNISLYERGLGLPSLASCVAIAQAFGISVSELIGDNLPDFDFDEAGLSGKADR